MFFVYLYVCVKTLLYVVIYSVFVHHSYNVCEYTADFHSQKAAAVFSMGLGLWWCSLPFKYDFRQDVAASDPAVPQTEK